MPTYSDTKTFPEADDAYSGFVNPAMIVIQANAGSVSIQADLGDDTFIEIPGSPFEADTAFQLHIANGRFRFVPSGGAKYGFNTRG